MRPVACNALFLIVGVAAFAQGDRGTITGTVSDPAGAVVANAAIDARHVETGTFMTLPVPAPAITPSRSCLLAATR